MPRKSLPIVSTSCTNLIGDKTISAQALHADLSALPTLHESTALVPLLYFTDSKLVDALGARPRIVQDDSNISPKEHNSMQKSPTTKLIPEFLSLPPRL
jgi:hypothetical protein